MSTEKGETLTRWVRQYTKELYAWALVKTSNPTLSEDLVQETFLAAAENMERFEGKSQPKTWLFGILKNKIADYYRKGASRPSPQNVPADELADFFDAKGRWKQIAKPNPWEENPENLLDDPTFVHILDVCLNALPALMRACLHLTYLQGKKGPEICQEIEISTTYYWKIMSRARIRLRDCLEKRWFNTNF